MMFLLDANTFITPKNSYYGFDLAPGVLDVAGARSCGRLGRQRGGRAAGAMPGRG